MLPQDIAKQFDVPVPHANRLTQQSFEDHLPLWEKGKQGSIPNHIISSVKRYPYYKLGKILGIETYRYLSIYDRFIFYFEEADGGACKGFCNLENRYVEWHKTSKGKYMLLISNATESSILFFDNFNFWHNHKEEIIKHAVRTNFYCEYNVMELLGEGSFSSVFAVRNKINGRKYAAKKISKFDKNNKSTKKLVIEERKILEQLSECPFASKIIEFYQENSEYILVLEYIEGKDLLAYLKDTPEPSIDTIKLILNSILLCLKKLHSEKIIHRDIKPHNILINSDLRCKLIDFGLSLDTRHPLEKSYFRKCGTVGYMAPEVFMNEFSHVRPYNNKCDMFSFGIVAHILLMGYNPLKGKSYEQSYELNRECKFSLDQKKINSRYGVQCFLFLRKLLDTNAKNRFTAEEALKSTFLQKMSQGNKENHDKGSSISTDDDKRKLSEESHAK